MKFGSWNFGDFILFELGELHPISCVEVIICFFSVTFF